MKTGSVKSLQNVRNDRSRLFAGRRAAPGSVKMEPMAVRVVAISEVADEEKSFFKLETLLLCRKWPAPFVGPGPFGKFRVQ